MSVIRRLRMVMVAGLAAALVMVFAPAAYAHGGEHTGIPYYLALGDSLAQGVQPNSAGSSVETDQGYVDDLYGIYRHQVPGLKLAKLGCPGETTGSMIHGGVCTYPQGDQLDQALSFLHSHHVVLITIDIGANNVDGCLAGGVITYSCIGGGIGDASADLPVILGALQEAAPGVPVVGMNYYDPFLAAWLQGAAGQVLASQSIDLAVGFNQVLDSAYSTFGDPVADVQTTFQTTDTSVLPFLELPVDVAVICAWTWMCAPAPQGPNIHANAFGYAAIAATFFTTLPHV